MKGKFHNFFKTSDNEQIFYTTNFKIDSSPKNVLVFNYGLVCSNFHFKEQVKFFDEQGYNILLHDYRGHYQSSGINDLEKITFHQLALDLKELVDFLGLSKITLIGHSMGVNVCLEFAKNFDSTVSKMILISGTILPVHNIMMNTHLTGPLKPILISLLEKYPKEFELFWKYGGWNPVIKKLIHAGGFNIDEVSSEFIEIYLNKLGQLGPDLFFTLIDQMQEHDILAFVHRIETKTLIIGGCSDKVIPNFLQRLMQSKLVNSQFYSIYKGSHVPQVDFPIYANERMDLFLTS